MERVLETEKVEGEVALVIRYKPGESHAIDVLQGAMALVESLDRLDRVLLSSVDTHLEPISILNDVERSSIKLLLSRALKSVPDEHIHNLDWKRWIGGLLVKGKHKLLSKLDADAPELRQAVLELKDDYKAAPSSIVGYEPPSISDIQDALDVVAIARARFPQQQVLIQTELGDIDLPDTRAAIEHAVVNPDQITVMRNNGRELLKVKQPDMLGNAQWIVMRNGRQVRVEILHRAWLEGYQARVFHVDPGDSLDCEYEETVSYDEQQVEIERSLSIIEVHRVVSPPQQGNLLT